MRLSVSAVRNIATLACPSAAIFTLAAAARGTELGDMATPLWRLGTAATLAVLAYSAAPRWRRSDIATLLTAFGLSLLLADRWSEGTWRADNLLGFAAGSYLVFLSSCLETLRCFMRSEPSTPFSAVYPRRRRGIRRTGTARGAGASV